ncbi:hypothetical protein BGZ83_006124 [Gryganskiella cystojenkinii]|nr:hypothetical protein BGZ83_006124 [Gryganskiella cystojenkinii]
MRGKYSPELSPAPSDDASEGTGSSRKSMTPTAKATLALNPGSSIDGTSAHQDQNGVKDKDKDKDDSLRRNSKTASSTSPMSSTLSSSTFSKDKRTTTTSQQSTSTSPTSATIHSTNNSTKGNNGKKTVIMRAPFPARAPAPPRGVAQLEEAMKDIRLYDSCLFWGKSGAVNLKPEGNSWDDDMVIQSKDPAWVRSSVPPPLPTNQELLILPPVAKIEKSIDVFLKNSHLYPPFITPLIVEQAKQTRSNLISRILLNTIAGIAIRIDPQIEQSTSKAGSSDFNASTGKKTTDANKQKYMRYFNRAYGLMIHLEDIRSTYSVTYLQATMLLCHVYPKPQLRVELLKLLTESAFLGLHVDCTRWMPKPIVIQNRTWLFWTCYIFDSVHHVVRGELSQMDDHYLEAPFPALTELDHDDGLWTRWFMLKEINLWRIGRKIHSYFQSQLKEKDRLVEASRKAVQQSQGSAQGQRNKKEPQQPAYFLNFPPEDILSSEYSEAELVLSLKLWTDDLPARLTAHIDSARLDRVDPRVNGRAVGLQAVFSMLKILLLYPNMLLIGTDLLSPTLPLPSPSLSPTSSSLSPQPSSSPMEMSLSSSSSSSSTPSPLAASTTSASHIPQIPIPGGGSALGLRSESISGTTPLSTLSWQQQIAQQQHSMRRKDYLDKIMQCVQEADRLVMWSTLIMERYPERARMACVGAGLDWCLRIYDKILMENKNLKTSSSTNGATNNPLLLSATPSSTFSPRFRSRCRGQVSKIAKLLQMFEDLDHRYYFSWLTIDLESLEERQKTSQQKMIERCLKVDKTSSTTAKVGVTGASSSMTTGTAPQQLSPNQNQILDLQDVGGVSGVASGREKVHDMESIIRKRTQMGVYALSGIQPNGGFPYGSGLGPDQQQQQQSTVLSNGGITGSSAGAFAFSGVSTSIADVPEVNDNGHWPLFDNIGISSSSTTLSSSASTGILSNSSIDSNNMYRNPNDNLMLSSMPFSSSTGQPQPIYHFEYNAAPQTLSNSSSSSSVLTTASYTPQQQGGPMPMFSSSRSSGGFDARFYPQGVSMSNSFPSTTTTGLTLIPSTGNNGEATALPLNVTTAMVGQQTLSSNNTMPSSSSLDLFFN